MEIDEIGESAPISVKKLKSLMIARRDYLVNEICTTSEEKNLFRLAGGISELNMLINGVLNLELKHNQEKLEEDTDNGRRERTITDEHERKLRSRPR